MELTENLRLVPVGPRPALLAGDGRRPEEERLEAVFESLGRDSVLRLISAPHPFGLPPRDKLAAKRWLSRQDSARRRGKDLTILLALVATGLAAALLFLSLSFAIYPSHMSRVGGSVTARQAAPL
ncbi:MAG TPA: hypothetical protein VJS47_11560 [Rhizomicrobium sp.]|nr:hypothetical protein [Rhizomicrobium sp.]